MEPKIGKSSSRPSLFLLGIDKEWIWSSENGWIDKKQQKDVSEKKIENNHLIEPQTHVMKKKWWMFWKKV
jgi:hypothetical protein